MQYIICLGTLRPAARHAAKLAEKLIAISVKVSYHITEQQRTKNKQHWCCVGVTHVMSLSLSLRSVGRRQAGSGLCRSEGHVCTGRVPGRAAAPHGAFPPRAPPWYHPYSPPHPAACPDCNAQQRCTARIDTLSHTEEVCSRRHYPKFYTLFQQFSKSFINVPWEIQYDRTFIVPTSIENKVLRNFKFVTSDSFLNVLHKW